jgi:hypothetical protein
MLSAHTQAKTQPVLVKAVRIAAGERESKILRRRRKQDQVTAVTSTVSLAGR